MRFFSRVLAKIVGIGLAENGSMLNATENFYTHLMPIALKTCISFICTGSTCVAELST